MRTNKLFYKKQKFIFSLILLCGLSLSVTAEQQDTLAVTQLDPVTVSALFKIPLEKSKLPREVNTISTHALATKGVELSQMLGQQAGIIVNGSNSAPGELKSVFFKGAPSRYVLLMIDGMPIVNPLDFGLELRSFAVTELEAVETASGGVATLYGNSGAAGVVNLITKKPKKTPIGLDAGIAYGFYNNIQYDASVSGTTNMFSYLVSYGRYQTDGISSATPEAQNLNQPFENDRFERDVFNIKLKFMPSSALSIAPFFRYSDISYDFDAGAFADDTVRNARQINWQGGLKAMFKMAPFLIDVAYVANRIEMIYKNPGFGNPYTVDAFSHNLDISARANNVSKPIQWVAGVQVQQHHLLDTALEQKSNLNINPYVSVIANWDNGLSLEAGIRIVYDEQYELNDSYNISLAYQVLEELRFFSSYSRSYLTPNLNQLYGKYGANPDLSPEIIHTFEIGAASYLINKQLHITASAFTRTISDVIIYALPSGYFNRDMQEDYGAELKVNYRVAQGIHIGTWYSFVDGFLTKQKETDTEIKYGLIRRPQHSAGLNFSMEVTKNWKYMIQTFYYSQREDAYFNPIDFSSSMVTLNPYILLNLSTSYSFLDMFNVYVNVRNLTDNQFTETYGYSTMGINITLGLKLSL